MQHAVPNFPNLPLRRLRRLVRLTAVLVLASAARSTENATPIWETRRVVTSEPVLFVRASAAAPAEAALLFRPTRLLAVRLANGSAVLPVDAFTVTEGRIVERTATTAPALARAELFPEAKTPHAYPWHADGRRYLHFSEGHYFHDLQVCIDYETDETWSGPVPASQSDLLPQLAARFAARRPVTLTLLGDSISAGYNASGFTQAAPRQPPYGDLFAAHLRERTGCTIAFHNLSKAGMRAAWGAAQIERVVATKPDLVVVAFGMNDGSALVPAEQFAQHLAAIVAGIRASLPETEFVLLWGMSPNPDWQKAEPAHRRELRQRLLAMQARHVAVCDVGALWDRVVARKGFWSLTGNGINHPNDYGHRLYADCLAATVLPPATRPPASRE